MEGRFAGLGTEGGRSTYWTPKSNAAARRPELDSGSRRNKRVRFTGLADGATSGSSVSTFNTLSLKYLRVANCCCCYLFRLLLTLGNESDDRKRDNWPKTSEYMYFKRFKGEGRSAVASSSNQMIVADSSSGVKVRSEKDADHKSFSIRERDIRSKRDLLCSANLSDFTVSAVDRSKCKGIRDEIYDNNQRWNFQKKSLQYNESEEDIFSQIRRKLRKRIEESCPEIVDLYAKGCDFISVLLKRLDPASCKEQTDSTFSPWSFMKSNKAESYMTQSVTQLKEEPSETRAEYDLVEVMCYNGVAQYNNLELENEPSSHINWPLSCSSSRPDMKQKEWASVERNAFFDKFNSPINSDFGTRANIKTKLVHDPASEIFLLPWFPEGDRSSWIAPETSSLFGSSVEPASEEHFNELNAITSLAKVDATDLSSYTTTGLYLDNSDRILWESQQLHNYQSASLSLYPRSDNSLVDKEWQNFDISSSPRLPFVHCCPMELPGAWIPQISSNINYTSARLGSLHTASSLSHTATNVNIYKCTPKRDVFLTSDEQNNSLSNVDNTFICHAFGVSQRKEIFSPGMRIDDNAKTHKIFTQMGDIFLPDQVSFESEGQLSFFQQVSDHKLLLDGQSEREWLSED